MPAAARTSTRAAAIDSCTLRGRLPGRAVRVTGRLPARSAVRSVTGLARVAVLLAVRVGCRVTFGAERGAACGPVCGPERGAACGPVCGPERGAACGPLLVPVTRLDTAALPAAARSPAGAAQIPVDRPSAMARHVCVDVTSAAGSLTASTG